MMNTEGIKIKPDREYFRQIAENIASKKYAVPAFQRDFVWDRRQIIELFDSIFKGYPIGSILLWRPPSEESFGYKDILTDQPTESQNMEYCILDGRQRLTAFFGCVSQSRDKKVDFCLYYDLQKKELTHKYSAKNKWLWAISELYDMFTLLTKAQSLVNEPNAQEYIDHARKINVLLREYEVGEIIINSGTLEDARVAFTRLNSKGTPISDMYMLQALSYSGDESIVLRETLNTIKQSLNQFGFQDIKDDDILACCYKYAGSRYMDKITPEDGREKLSFIESVGDGLKLATQFLHDDCFILSSRLFPYSSQIVPICYFFKQNPNPTLEQKKELKRWILYTIYTQQLSGSLTDIRAVFDRFDKFVEGEESAAYDEYTPVDKPTFNFKFSTGNAKSSFLLISMVKQRLNNNSPIGIRYFDKYTFVTNSPAGIVPLFTNEEFEFLRNSLRDKLPFEYDRFCLTSQLVTYLYNKQYDIFTSQRALLLSQFEEDFLKESGIEVNPDILINKNTTT